MHIYKLQSGARVPSVTTITSRYKDSSALIHWAWEEGINGRDYRESRDKAAGAGTLAHAMIEAHLRGQPLPTHADAELHAKAMNSFGAAKAWLESSKMNIVYSEVPLVSEVHRFGGRLDAIAELDGQLSLADWKTGGIYAEHLIQVAGYAILWEENYPDKPLSGGFELCRFNRDHGDFGHKHYPLLPEAKEAFLSMRRLYDIDKDLKRRAA